MVLFGLYTIIVSILTGSSMAQWDLSAAHCLQGPSFWCLNETTEALCNFNNKTIGLCGYTNKRCQIKTGE